MAKNKNIIKAIGTCEDSNLLANFMFQKGISAPKNLTLKMQGATTVKPKGEIERFYTLYYSNPILDLYPDSCKAENNSITIIINNGETIKDFIESSKSQIKLRSMIKEINDKIKDIKKVVQFHIFFNLGEYENLSEEMVKAIDFDNKESSEDNIGFDRVFLNVAAKYGVYKEELEIALRHEVKRIKSEMYINPNISRFEKMREVFRMAFANKKFNENKKLFPSYYKKTNTLIDPVFDKLPAFNGCPNELKIDMMFSNWHYISGKYPVLTSTVKLPETMRNTYEGKPINSLFKEPIFGGSQKIKRIWGTETKTNIMITPEVVPFGEYEKILKAA